MDVLPQLQLLAKVLIASLLAGLVGFEREWAERPAGLRTHMLVGGTSAFLVIMSVRAIAVLSTTAQIRADPVAIIQAIVIGISFLGAGTIFKSTRPNEEPVQGLTTAASVLSVAAVGVAVAFDAYVLALGVTLWNIVVNWALGYMVERMKRAAGK